MAVAVAAVAMVVAPVAVVRVTCSGGPGRRSGRPPGHPKKAVPPTAGRPGTGEDAVPTRVPGAVDRTSQVANKAV
ncbi:hypothetical protein C6376_25420 [Streptomyces sp. P3]|nr:hypothetical protein C6376_25420 [Streptomyces sp. P3]